MNGDGEQMNLSDKFFNIADDTMGKIYNIMNDDSTNDFNLKRAALMDTPFLDVLDSLQLEQLRAWLIKKLGIPVPLNIFFSSPTPRLLQESLSNTHSNKHFFGDDYLRDELSRATVLKNIQDPTPSRVCKIGIIGMSCRFPGGANSPAMFWEMLCDAMSTSTKIPFGRWDVDAETARHKNLSRTAASCLNWGSFVDELELFDASFFGISAAEARLMDPQQRMLLECAHIAFVDAGLSKESLFGRNIGVFVGISPTELEVKNYSAIHSINATDHATSAGRISFVFGLQGPCAAYSTACSSSLVALHAAVRSLQHNECELAIVLGVSAFLSEKSAYARAVAGMLSPTGQCHTFDESADGYLRGEGCGAVVLTQTDLLNEVAYGVIAGVSVAQDGMSASLTAPNGLAQEKLLRSALADAGLVGGEVDYLEAHGTGTPLGDPIEMSAVANVMSQGRASDSPLVVGAVKANIGHLLAASGMAGLIKTVLVLLHEQAPPNAALHKINPKIAEVVKDAPICFPTKSMKLGLSNKEPTSKSLVAGVSSFGFAGTIAHSIVCQVPADRTKALSKGNPFNVFPHRKAVPWHDSPHPLLQVKWESSDGGFTHACIFHSELMKLLKDHCIQDRAVFPAVGYIEMALASSSMQLKKQSINLERISFLQPLDISPGQSLYCDVGTNNVIEFRTTGAAAAASNKTTYCRVQHFDSASMSRPKGLAHSLANFQNKCYIELLGVNDRYQALQDMGFHGPQFQTLVQVWRDVSGKSLLAKLRVPEADQYYFSIHPATLDGALQLMRFLHKDTYIMPAAVGRIEIFKEGSQRASDCASPGWVWASVQSVPSNKERDNSTHNVIDINIYEPTSGRLYMKLESVQYGRFPPSPGVIMYESSWKRAENAIKSELVLTNPVNLGIMGPGTDKVPNSLTDLLNSSGYTCTSVSSSIDSLVWDEFDAVLIPLLFRPIESVDVIESVVLETLAVFKSIIKLSISHKADGKYEDRKRKIIMVVTPLVEGLSKNDALGFGAVWAFLRTVRSEIDKLVSLKSVAVDFSPNTDVGVLVSQINHTLTSDEKDCELGYLDGHQYVRKLFPSSQQVIGPVSVIAHQTPGQPDVMEAITATPKCFCLSPGEVRVRICAIGLNNNIDSITIDEATERDNELPQATFPVEFSGEVIHLPEGLDTNANGASYPFDGFAKGDKVFGVAMNFTTLLCSEAIIPQYCLSKVPANVVVEDAATLSLDFIVANDVLVHQAKLKVGNSILVCVDGRERGVALTAVQLAHTMGAHVIVICDDKDTVIYLMSLGVIGKVLDKDTSERPMVDVVLLPAEVSSGLQLLAVSMLISGGTCIQILKSGSSHIDATSLPIRPDITYKSYHVRSQIYCNPNTLSASLKKLEGLLKKGELMPLPKEVFSIRGQLSSALEALKSDALHGRKIVVSVEPSATLKHISNGVIIITGGLGGLGLVTAEALAEAGARCLLLVSRSGHLKHDKQGLEQRLQDIRARGVSVTTRQCDVSDEEQVIALLSWVRSSQSFGPITGIVHAAGTLADAMLLNQSADMLHSVWGPKAKGAWYLHKHSLEDGFLKFFSMFSSVASLFGIPGQANYSAANAYLDDLARTRTSMGLPAISIQWPAVLGVGMVAAMDSSIRPDASHCITISGVKRVVKQCLSGLVFQNPVQSPIPIEVLRSHNVTSFVDDLDVARTSRLHKGELDRDHGKSTQLPLAAVPSRPSSLSVKRLDNVPVTWVTCLDNTLSADILSDLLDTYDSSRTLVFEISNGNNSHVDDPQLSEAMQLFSKFQARLEDSVFPTIVVCRGAVYGIGSFFVSIADLVVAADDTTLSFSSLAVCDVIHLRQRRLSEKLLHRLIITGETVDLDSTIRFGLVDLALPGSWRDVTSSVLELTRTRDFSSLRRALRSERDMSVACLLAGNYSASRAKVAQARCTVGSNAVRMKWYNDTGIVTLELGAPEKSSSILDWDMVESIKDAVNYVKTRQDLRAVIVIGAGADFDLNADPTKWVQKNFPSLNESDESLSEVAAVLFQAHTVLCDIWSTLPVPVLTILHGRVSTVGAVLALSTDYRFAVDDVSIDLSYDKSIVDLTSLFSIIRRITGEQKFLGFLDLARTNQPLNANVAYDLNLVSRIGRTKGEAFKQAIELAKSIENAPINGIRSTMTLLRHVSSIAQTSYRCVAQARKMCKSSIKSQEQERVFQIQGLIMTVTLSPSTTLNQIISTLHHASKVGVRVVSIFQASNTSIDGVSTFTEAVMSLAAWLQLDHRPKLLVVCDGKDISILPSMIADESHITDSTTFGNTVLPDVIYAFAARKLKSSSRLGRFMCHSGSSLTAEEALRFGIVEVVGGSTDALFASIQSSSKFSICCG